MRNIFGPLAALVLFVFPIGEASGQAARGQMDPKLTAIRTELGGKIADGSLPSVSVGVVRGGKTVWKESFGYADIERKIAATPDTIYALGSLSKSITGTAVFKLVEEGQIDLDKPIGRYLKTVAIEYQSRDAGAYKVYHLLNMAAGIPHYWRYCYTEAGPLDKCRNELLGQASFAAFSPGAVHTYSNLSFGLAAQMVADVSGQRLSLFMRNKIFRPAGMKNTYTHLSEMPANRSATAKPYRADGKLAPAFQFEPTGGGGFYSTVNDLLKYGSLHLEVKGRGERVLSLETQKENHRVRAGLPHEFYANGWGVLPLADGRRTLLSNGAIEGAASTLLVLPDTGIVIVVLINKSVGNDVSDGIAFRIADTLLPGYKKDLDSLFEKVGPLFASSEFSADKSLEGLWTGSVSIYGRKVPFEINFSGSSATVTVDNFPPATTSLRFEQGMITWSADLPGIGRSLRSSTDRVNLNLRLEGKRIVGFIQTEILKPRPEFLLAFPFEAARR